MSVFTSSREKIYWLGSLAVVAAIFASLFIGRPLADQLRDQNTQAVFFMIGLILVAAVVVVHGLQSKPGRWETVTLLGIIAVYTMLIFRLGAPERSHLIEYSVLAVFLHKALAERAQNRRLYLNPAIMAIGISFVIGVLDEAIQILIPHRVFDPEDILFNGMAIIMAIGFSVLLKWIRKKSRTKRK